MKYWLLASAFFLASNRGAFAEPVGTRVITFQAGSVHPLSNVNALPAGGAERGGSAGFTVGAQGLYYLTRHWATGLDGTYSKTGARQTAAFSPLANSTVLTKSSVILVVGKYSFRPERRVTPYFLGGLGLTSTTLKIDAVPATGLKWPDSGTAETRNVAEDGGYSYAVALGAGVDAQITRALFVGAEARYQYTGSPNFGTHYPPDGNGNAFGGITGFTGGRANVKLLGRIGHKF